MTKAELIARLAESADLTKAQTEKVLNTLVSVVTEEIKISGGLTLTGLGTFSVARRAARQGRNPKTMAPIDIPASNAVKFKVAKALKDAVN